MPRTSVFHALSKGNFITSSRCVDLITKITVPPITKDTRDDILWSNSCVFFGIFDFVIPSISLHVKLKSKMITPLMGPYRDRELIVIPNAWTCKKARNKTQFKIGWRAVRGHGERGVKYAAGLGHEGYAQRLTCTGCWDAGSWCPECEVRLRGDRCPKIQRVRLTCYKCLR